jgi:hypothetical protein
MLLCHAGEYMRNAKKLNLSLAILSNDGCENRHAFGRGCAKKSFWGGRWRENFPDFATKSNLSCYLCLLQMLSVEDYKDKLSAHHAEILKLEEYDEDEIISLIPYESTVGSTENTPVVGVIQMENNLYYVPDRDHSMGGAPLELIRQNEDGYGSDDHSDEEISDASLAFHQILAASISP